MPKASKKPPPGRSKRASRSRLAEGPAVFERRVNRHLKQWEGTGRGASFLVGLSGGADSVALLRVLVALAPREGWRVRAFHVHHGLRGKTADADAAFAKKLCKKLGVPYGEARLRVGKGSALAERAREARHAALEKEARRVRTRWIALAHQADDQAETVLSRLVRGAPAAGLAGIPAVRGKIIRPLLEESRASILHYLENLGQKFREDPSNRALSKSERARVRHLVLPMLEREFRRPVRESLARAGRELAEVGEFLEAEARRARGKLVRKERGGVSLPLPALKRLASPVRRELWRELLGELWRVRHHPGAAQIDALEGLLPAGGSRSVLSLGEGVTARLVGGRIVLRKGT